jgi:hypothetical protein
MRPSIFNTRVYGRVCSPRRLGKHKKLRYEAIRCGRIVSHISTRTWSDATMMSRSMKTERTILQLARGRTAEGEIGMKLADE